MQISQDDLLKAIEDALKVKEGGGEGKTVQEMSDETGRNDDQIRKGLKVIQRQGRLVVHQVTRTSIAGHPHRVPVYSIRGEK